MGIFSDEALHHAVQAALVSSTVPEAHGFAALVDLNGAHVGLATRTERGWSFAVDAGYQWTGTATGPSGQVKIGKTW